MRADHLRIYKAVHTWTGIVSGMALFIAFYAGALTVFKDPIAHWATPPRAERVLPLDAVQPLIVQALAAAPAAARDFTLRLQDAGHAVAQIEWQERPPGADDHDDTATRHYRAHIEGAGVQVSEVHPAPLATFIDVLHRVVGLPTDSDPHRWVMGVVAVLYSVALFSGVVVLLPSLVKDFFALRVGRNLKRMWLDAHNVVGIVSLPLHIVMALTAVVFAYHDQIYDMQDHLLHRGQWAQAFQRPGPAAAAAPPPARDPALLVPAQQLVLAARALAPGFEPAVLQYQQATGPRATVRLWGKDAGAVSPRARGGFVAFDAYTGKVLSTDYLPGRQSTPNLFISSFFALHMASFGGTAVQWMYFALGLAGAWLFYGGNLLWVESRRKAQRKGADRPTQRRDAAWMAAATVGVCVGCVAGVSLTIAAGKWFQAQGAHLQAWHMGMYYAAFFGCIGWAFWRGAARAAPQLLWLAAGCTAAIPLTSALGWAVPGLGWWAHTDGAALAVDLTAVAGALALGWMARATARRVRSGPHDSVWSVRTAAPLQSGAPSTRDGSEAG